MTTFKPQNYIFLSKSLSLNYVNTYWKGCSNFTEVPFYTAPEPYLQCFFQWFWSLILNALYGPWKLRKMGFWSCLLEYLRSCLGKKMPWTYSRPAKEVRSWLHSKSPSLLWKDCFKAETINSLFLRLWKTHRDFFEKKIKVVMVAHA